MAKGRNKTLHNTGKAQQRGPKTPQGKAKALGNLKMWKAGESGNPKGRPSAGAAVKEWWNVMQGWSETALLEVSDDPNAPINKKAAARAWLKSCADDNLAGGFLDRILEHTDGKAVQHIDHTTNGNNIEFFEREQWEKV